MGTRRALKRARELVRKRESRGRWIDTAGEPRRDLLEDQPLPSGSRNEANER